MLKSVPWSQMVADLFNSPLKVDSEEEVTSKWAALHATSAYGSVIRAEHLCSVPPCSSMSCGDINWD